MKSFNGRHNSLTPRLRSFLNRLLNLSCRGIWNNLTHVQFDHGLTARKIDQHSHPLAGGDNASDHGPQALKCAGGDFHRVPGMKVMLETCTSSVPMRAWIDLSLTPVEG